MKVNNNEYGFTIEPFYGSVLAEIFKVGEGNINIHLTDKKFGKWCRSPIKEDYVKVKEWAEEQLQNIFHANK